jgi:hypothetical protein
MLLTVSRTLGRMTVKYYLCIEFRFSSAVLCILLVSRLGGAWLLRA